MKLSGQQVAAIRDALLFGYTSKQSLSAMVRTGLGSNLDAIAGGDTLEAQVMSLIDWAERTGNVRRLVNAAVADNPANPLIAALPGQLDSWELDEEARGNHAASEAPTAPATGGRPSWLMGGLVAAGLLVLVLLGFQFWNSGQGSQPPDPPATGLVQWSGRVVDAATSQPLAQAKVTFEAQGVPLLVYTDSEGVFRLSSEGKDQLSGRLFVEVAGYQPYDRFVTIDPAVPSLQDIRLAKA
jgi:hypothetical protein